MSDSLLVLKGCYNSAYSSTRLTAFLWMLGFLALDAMQNQSLVVKFCKAGGWNDKLATWKVTFKTRREELQFALTLNSATMIQDMSSM